MLTILRYFNIFFFSTGIDIHGQTKFLEALHYMATQNFHICIGDCSDMCQSNFSWLRLDMTRYFQMWILVLTLHVSGGGTIASV